MSVLSQINNYLPLKQSLVGEPDIYLGAKLHQTKLTNGPFSTDYCAKTGVSDPLVPELASFYQHLIGVMRWMVEQGRVDIATEFLSCRPT